MSIPYNFTLRRRAMTGELWKPPGTFTKIYYPAEYASYYVNSGERITSGVRVYNGMPVIMQGSSDGTVSKIAGTMIFFPNEQIMRDLYGANIRSVSLRMACIEPQTRPTRTPAFYTRYGTGYSSCPNSWEGTDDGYASSNDGYIEISTGDSRDITIKSVIIERIISGTPLFIDFNTSNAGNSFHGELDASQLALTVKYSYK